jgi:LacI family transcriptional regulator
MSTARRQRRKTIVHVAEAAGVAIKTVSRVLNNEPNVRPQTRERVLAAVKALNYHPSISARGLAGRRSYVIGLVYENPSANYIMDVQHGAMNRCRADGLLLITHHCSKRGAALAEEIGELADQTHVAGMVLTPPLSASRELIRALDARSLPFVRISPNKIRHASPYVDIDDQAAAFEMTEYLIGLGHRRIGFVVGNPEHYASGRRYAGYEAALKKHGIPLVKEYVQQGYFTFESGVDCGRRLLDCTTPPTAIFASNDDMAAGVLIAAHERRVRIPGQLSVAGFDDAQIAQTVWPRLTTVQQPAYDLAYAATDLLLKMLKAARNGEPRPRPQLFTHRIVVRESTGLAPDVGAEGG